MKTYIDFNSTNSLHIGVQSIEGITGRWHFGQTGLEIKLFGYSLEGVMNCLLEDYGYEKVKEVMMDLMTEEERNEMQKSNIS